MKIKVINEAEGTVNVKVTVKYVVLRNILYKQVETLDTNELDEADIDEITLEISEPTEDDP